MLRISRVTLYRMLESGAIRGWRIDRHWRFLGSDIEACTQRQARTTPRRRKV